MSWNALVEASLPFVALLSIFCSARWLLRRKEARHQAVWSSSHPVTSDRFVFVHQSPADFWRERGTARPRARTFEHAASFAEPQPMVAARVAVSPRAPSTSASVESCRTTWIAQGRCWECGGRPILGEYRCLRCYSHN
jgi:hypothetical protein